jgi:hypothetical protein
MTAAVIRFPPRFSHAIWITRQDTAWVVLARGHGWTFGRRGQALVAAQWLARNLDLPICEQRA